MQDRLIDQLAFEQVIHWLKIVTVHFIANNLIGAFQLRAQAFSIAFLPIVGHFHFIFLIKAVHKN